MENDAIKQNTASSPPLHHRYLFITQPIQRIHHRIDLSFKLGGLFALFLLSSFSLTCLFGIRLIWELFAFARVL